MPKILETLIKRAIRAAGYEIKRRPPFASGVGYDPYSEQRRLLGDGVRTIYEVGAANGADSLRYVRLFPGATVYAFEPLPQSFAKIPVHNRIVPVAAAVSSYNGRASFKIAKLPDSSSLLQARLNGSVYDKFQQPVGTVEVDVLALDSFVQSHPPPDLLKMDAQGAELDILKGAQSLRPSLIFTEVQFNDGLYEGAADFTALTALLGSRGYKLHNLYGIHSHQWGEIAWADAIFVRATKSEEEKGGSLQPTSGSDEPRV